jgi:hypothetical protein
MRFYLGKRLSGGTWGGVSASPSDFERPVTRGIGRVIGRLFLTTVVAMVTGVGVGGRHGDGRGRAVPYNAPPVESGPLPTSLPLREGSNCADSAHRRDAQHGLGTDV